MDKEVASLILSLTSGFFFCMIRDDCIIDGEQTDIRFFFLTYKIGRTRAFRKPLIFLVWYFFFSVSYDELGLEARSIALAQ